MPISYLNDFVFCPYSVYLHQVFDKNSDDLFSALPQQRGKTAHWDIDQFETKELREVLKGAFIISKRLGIFGKIDTFYVLDKKLVESKYEIKTIYKGYLYQLWCQYFALIEMGYEVQFIHLYSIKNNKTIVVDIPGVSEFTELQNNIRNIAWFDFEKAITPSKEKCIRCVYASLCDKTELEHVYT